MGPGGYTPLIFISLQELPWELVEPEAPMEDSKVEIEMPVFFHDSKLPFFIVWQNLAVRKMQKDSWGMG